MTGAGIAEMILGIGFFLVGAFVFVIDVLGNSMKSTGDARPDIPIIIFAMGLITIAAVLFSHGGGWWHF